MNAFKKFLLKTFNLFYPKKVYGLNNIPEGGALFAGNHLSALDPIMRLDIYNKDAFILAKKEIFKCKLVGAVVKAYGGIPIDRQKPDIQSLLKAVKVLKTNKKLIVFPEGTRNKTKTDKIQQIKGGTGVFAVKSKCPIVPIIALKKPRIFIKNSYLIGKPFYLDAFYGKKLDDAVIQEIDEMITKKMVETQIELKNLVGGKKNK